MRTIAQAVDGLRQAKLRKLAAKKAFEEAQAVAAAARTEWEREVNAVDHAAREVEAAVVRETDA